jgi:hypothetical protein
MQSAEIGTNLHGTHEFDTKPIDFDWPVQKIRNLVGP